MDLVVELRPRAPHDLGRSGQVDRRAFDRLLRELERERDRFVHELDGLEQAVGEVELERPARVVHAVLAQRVRDDHLDRGLGADELRDQLRPAPGGDDSEQHLGRGEVAYCSRDRPRRAVERDLDGAADADAVDRRDGRERERAEAGEELVAGAAAELGELARRRLRELGDVGARAEDQRFARQDEGAPLLRLDLGERPVERLERSAAERRRLPVVLAVPDRQERDVAVDALELELSLGHPGFPRSRRRPCPCRCRAQSSRSGRSAARRSRTRAAPSGGRRSRRVGGRRRSLLRTGSAARPRGRRRGRDIRSAPGR